MCTIIDVKKQFNSKDCFDIYLACMYMPTYETYFEKANLLMEDEHVYVFGSQANGKLNGIIAIKLNDNKNAEIVGIAVDSSYRNQGIGKQLITHIMNNFNIDNLFAETDDDAILFYRKCGFITEECYKTYKTGVFKRYKCNLLKNKYL